jgi:hypothetical protein
MDVRRRSLLLGGAVAAAGAAAAMAVPLLRPRGPVGEAAAPDPPGGFDPLLSRLACGWLPEGFRLHQTVLGRHRQSMLGSRPGWPESFLVVTLYRPGIVPGADVRSGPGASAGAGPRAGASARAGPRPSASAGADPRPSASAGADPSPSASAGADPRPSASAGAAARFRWRPDGAHWATVELAGAPDPAAAERTAAGVRVDQARPVTLALRTPGLPAALRLQEVLLYQPAAPEGWACGAVFAPTPVPLDAGEPHSSLTVSVEPLDHARHHPIFDADQGAEVTIDGRLGRWRETADREHLAVLDAGGFFVTVAAVGTQARRHLGREGVVGVFRRLQILPSASPF